MKRISYLRPILVAWVMMSAIACTKPEVTPTFSHGTVPAPQEHYRVANNWHADGYGNFVSVFGDMRGTGSFSPYTVYVLKNNVKTLISGGGTSFEGGTLWSETTQGSLSIHYRMYSAGSTITFTSVELVVIF